MQQFVRLKDRCFPRATARTSKRRKEEAMSNTPEMSSSSMSLQFIKGTPVYDSDGDQVGHVSEPAVEGDHLVLRKGRFFPKHVYIPLSAVQSVDANAVYLNMTREELMHERYESPQGPTQPASTTVVDRGHHVHIQGRGVVEEHPDTYQRGVDEIEEHPDTYQRGVDEIEEHPDTYQLGVDTIERQP
jgi:hypothetical protein